MGLLDSITSALGDSAKGLENEVISSALKSILGDKVDVSSIVKNMDISKAKELLEFFKKNGVPDTKEEIMELISKFTKPAPKNTNPKAMPNVAPKKATPKK